MGGYNLDGTITIFTGPRGRYGWTLRQAVEGLQIFGGIGSGKTSGSGRTIALEYLRCQFGGLVLTVKNDERKLWEQYCEETGRLNDLIVISPDSNQRFNFINYEMNRKGRSKERTDNLVHVLQTIINVDKQHGESSNNEAFWQNSLNMLMYAVIDLCQLAYGKVTLDRIIAIAQSIPKNMDALKKPSLYSTEFGQAMLAIRDKRNAANMSDKEFRLYKNTEDYIINNYIGLADKTRSTIEQYFLGTLASLHRDPIYSLFCSNDEDTFTPEDSLDGKIILLDIPIKEFDKVGRNVQILFKYIWQRSMERRKQDSLFRPVFLWADEAQNFIHEHDITYQATARSQRICTVYLTQNLPNYYNQIGGKEAENMIASFLGTMGTKIFHANVDKKTNDYAADLIGKDFIPLNLAGHSSGAGEPSFSSNESKPLHHIVPPERFAFLRTGGEINDNTVDSIIHCQNPPWAADDISYHLTSFTQKKS